MIDFEYEESIPNEILKRLIERKDVIKNEIRTDTKRIIQGHQWTGGKIQMPYYDDTKQDLLEILKNKTIKGFHCTKLLDIDSVTRKGIRVLDKREYRNYMLDFFKSEINDSTLLEKINQCFNESESEDFYSNRENMVWFLITKSLVYDTGCDDFFKYLGGESIRRILYEIKEDTYHYLENFGIPTVITFGFQFDEIAMYQQDNLIKELIRSRIFDLDDEEYRPMSSEGYIRKNVQPGAILEIINDLDINRLKNTIANRVGKDNPTI